MPRATPPQTARESYALRRSKAHKLDVQIADFIRDNILSGLYTPGQKLSVDAVARDLQVSHMPVREAMVALAQEGILEMRPRRGFSIGYLRRTDLEDIISVHAFIAGTLAERAAEALDTRGLANLRDIQSELEASALVGDGVGERKQIGDLNFQFHQRINQSVGSRRLAWFMRTVTRYVPRQFYEDVAGLGRISIEDHPQILAALESKDGRVARETAEMHVRRTGRRLIEHLSESGFWESHGH